MAVSMDEMNYLVWKYMQENGFPHSAFVFDTESLASATNIATAQVPPNSLISLLQKSLIYLKIEKKIRMAQRDGVTTVTDTISQISALFPANPDSATIEGLAAPPFDTSNSLLIETGDATPVAAIAVSPDGHKIAVLHVDACGSIFVPESRELVPFGRASPETAGADVAWHPSSELFAITGATDTPLFNLMGEVVLTIPVVSTALAFSSEKLVLASKEDFLVTLWSVSGGSPAQLARFDLHKEPIRSIAVSPYVIATACIDKCVGFAPLGSGAVPQRLLRAHTRAVSTLAFAGALLVSGGADGALFLWRGGQQAGVIRAHSGAVSALAVHPAGQAIASAGADGCVKIWDLAGANECVAVMGRHPRGATVAAFHPRGELLATGGRDGILGLWRWRESKMVSAFSGGSEIVALAFDPDGRFVVVAVDGPVPVIVQVGQWG
jgi:WD40 repeat protein